VWRAIPVALWGRVGGTLVGAVMWNLRPSHRAAVTQFLCSEARTSPIRAATGRHFAGRHQMVYVANQRLLRSMAQLDARIIPGTEITQGVLNPSFRQTAIHRLHSNADSTLENCHHRGAASRLVQPRLSRYELHADGTSLVRAAEASCGPANGGKPELLVSVKDGELAWVRRCCQMTNRCSPRDRHTCRALGKA
jgi:hypothetical protein